ncbi:hypothetical protein GHT06_014470 [Daphnia sinensis]|uniref:Uncharacterized protein n=1 Tax=Daphnia sinensis TaxID=1820382 RepID=A0AAD5KTU2_9CRUS|nr:hypothetical protein GHT06_014470 [Daphnia sinensis]
MKCGNSFHIIAGKAPFLYVPNSVEALTSLIAVYYVFDLQWCKEAMTVLLFIESEVIARKTEQSKCCNAVNLLKNLLR